MKEKLFALIVFIALLTSCKKEEVDNRSYKLTLLQHKWTPIVSWMYLRDGSKFKLIPFESVTYTSDWKVIIPYYVYDPTFPPPFYKLKYLVNGYQLMPDDSTLLLYPVTNGIQSTEADTSYIQTITDHLLVYNFINNNFIWGLDSLKR